jgi:hypothetical protein
MYLRIYMFFKLARCGYTLRVTSQKSYSPEYTTPTQKKITLLDYIKFSHGKILYSPKKKILKKIR